MHTTHLIALSLAAAALVACNPKETVKALTSDQNVTQEMAVRFAENMVGLPRRSLSRTPEKPPPVKKSP